MAVAELAFAFMAGTTVSGMAGSLMELAADQPLSFSEPYFSRRRLLRSMATVAIAGPLMFTNDALRARREGRISRLNLLLCSLTAIVWSTSLGIVVVGLAAAALRPLV